MCQSSDLKLPGTCMQAVSLVLLQENHEGSSKVQVRRRKLKPSHKVSENLLVDKTNAVNKKQNAAKQQAAKANRQARKGKEVADSMEGYEVSIALLICTHQSNALQTTREWMAALQVIRTERRGTAATAVLGQHVPK